MNFNYINAFQFSQTKLKRPTHGGGSTSAHIASTEDTQYIINPEAEINIPLLTIMRSLTTTYNL